MEVQIPQQQSVQINLNNKIITLHNVTIVKNPRIVKVDAAQYSNLLLKSANGGAPIKFVTSNGNGTANSIKLPIPSLVPMKRIATTTTTPVIQTVIKQQQPNIMTTQVIKTIQQPQLPLTFKTSPTILTATVPSTKIQTIPVKQQPTVIITPPKQQQQPPPLTVDVSPPPIQQIKFNIQSTQQNQTSVITKPAPIIINSTASLTTAPTIPAPAAVLPIQTKVIVSPPIKNKIKDNGDDLSSPSPKKSKVELECVFCEEKFVNEPQKLVEHVKNIHPEKIPKKDEESQDLNNTEIDEKMESSSESSSESSDSDESSSESEGEEEEDEEEDDDDASEVNDLINDLEDTQDTIASSQEPESPEFEEHVPSQLSNSQEEENEIKDEIDELFAADDDDYEWDLLAFILEPFCDLQYEHDSDEEGHEEDNEALKLYREAMELNYQQNGIKKRGRRKTRTPKTTPVANTATPIMDGMNGILANLLEPAIKIPQGPGRGRRKETNEQELEQDRSNGVCFFQCTQCDKSFKFAGDLAKHVRSHTISSPYRCSICKKVFTHIGSLNTHLRIHSGERPYKCKFCEKSFTQSNSLMVHVKSHLSNKPFSCNQCNKGFLNASSLAVHQKTHNGPVVAVVCPIETCGKEFRDNNLLEEHMQTHKQSMLYQCSLCLEKFEQAAQLVQHVKSHIGDKPFQCTICSRSFTQPGSLNTHLRIHTGEKPFSCALCPKRFTQASSLSVHMKIHGEKEFKCDVCEKSYSQEVFLQKHKLKHKEDGDKQNENDFSSFADDIIDRHE